VGGDGGLRKETEGGPALEVLGGQFAKKGKCWALENPVGKEERAGSLSGDQKRKRGWVTSDCWSSI